MSDTVTVPVEPTEAMLDAYWRYSGESKEMRARTHHRGRRIWTEMLSAAPPSEPGEPAAAYPDRAQLLIDLHKTQRQCDDAEATVERLTKLNGTWKDNMQNAWAALRMIRETVETLGPVGALISEEAVLGEYGPEPLHEATAIVEGIRVWAERLTGELAAAREALRRIIDSDQKEKRTCIEFDPAGSTYDVTLIDGPCAHIARAALVSSGGDDVS